MHRRLSRHKAEDRAGTGRGSRGWKGSEGAFLNTAALAEGVSNYVCACKLVCTVTGEAGLMLGGEHGLPPQLWGVPLGHPVWRWQLSRNQCEVFAIFLLFRVWVYGWAGHQRQKWRLMLLGLRFPVSGAMGGMLYLCSEEGGKLSCLFCASFLRPETEVRLFWL